MCGLLTSRMSINVGVWVPIVFQNMAYPHLFTVFTIDSIISVCVNRLLNRCFGVSNCCGEINLKNYVSKVKSFTNNTVHPLQLSTKEVRDLFLLHLTRYELWLKNSCYFKFFQKVFVFLSITILSPSK